MKRRWRLLGGATIAAALWWGVPSVARRMTFFEVRRIEFVGMRHLAPETAVAALALPERFNLFESLDSVEARAAAIPGVARATVSRRLPGTIVVELDELPPVALIHRRGRLVLMDSAGRVLPYDPRRNPSPLPVADGPDEAIGRLLRRVQVEDAGFFARIDGAGRDGRDVVLQMDGRRVLLRPDASFEEMRAVKAVAEDLAREGIAYRELDGRYRGYVVVRGRGA
ncbi:MAG TPA: FtsQ-type POTRA domain-containing protein [Gemmatimonadales bacterium]